MSVKTKKIIVNLNKKTMAAPMGGGFDFGSGAFNIGLQAFQDDRARDWAAKESEISYLRDIEQRDYQNWYNSPQQQMERFNDAGLNPNLIYGQGTPGQQTSTPHYQPAKGQYSQLDKINFLGMINAFFDIKKKKQEIDLVSENVNSQRMSNQIMQGVLQTKIDFEQAKLNNMLQKTKNEAEKQAIQKQIQALNEQRIIIETKKAEWANQGFTDQDSSLLRIGFQQMFNPKSTLQQAWKDYQSK